MPRRTPPLGRSTAARSRAQPLALLVGLLALACALPSAAAARTYSSISVAAGSNAYVLASEAGEMYAFGLPWRGNPAGFSGRIVGVSSTANGAGYAAVSSAGQVYAYGNVRYHGNPQGFSGEIAGIAVTADGSGYVIASTAGQVYAYNVPYHGNAVGFAGRITGIAVNAGGSGYHLVSSAGQVYAFGNVAYHGNAVGFTGEIVAISSRADGHGYVLVSSAGQVYAWGVAYHGNPAGFSGRIVAISARADGGGYAAVSSAGQVYAYAVPYAGNGTPPPAPPTPAPPPGPSPAPPPSSLGNAIAAIARREAANPTRNVERGAANCNFYSGALGVGVARTRCPPGWRSQLWCADFGKWVWRDAGARTSGLSSAAKSFRTYGVKNRTWRPGRTLAGARIGDAVVLQRGSGGHVAFVVGVRAAGSVEVISGNSGDRVRREIYTPGKSNILGLTSPVR